MIETKRKTILHVNLYVKLLHSVIQFHTLHFSLCVDVEHETHGLELQYPIALYFYFCLSHRFL